jgi:glycine betaine catabolism B
MLKLKSVNFNHQQFQEYNLEFNAEYQWLIGRDPRCQLVLTTLDVSRTHARILYEDEVYYFENISQHGSTVNQDELLPHEKKPIHKGDLLVLGETYLQVEELATPSDRILQEPIAASWAGDLQCCRIIEETADVKTFCFTSESETLFDYKPGQFVNLELEIEGKTIVRPYSISSSPTRPHHLAITIKRLPQLRADLPPGLVSNWMHDRFQVGDRLKLKGSPMGNFTCLPDVPPKILFLSAGSGITPMMSMARWIQDTLTPCDVVFIHSARTPEDIIYRTELETMAAQMPNFQLVFTVSRPPEQSNWAGLTGRISAMMLQLLVPDLNDRAIYVCGSKDWMGNIKSILTQLEFPMTAYKEESFGSGAPAIAPVTDETENILELSQPNSVSSHPASSPADSSPNLPSGQISFTQSSVKAPADSDLSILELAEQEGVTIPNACRSGMCGACKVHVQGQVRYAAPPNALPASDREAGYALACIAHPVGALEVSA